MNPDLLEISSQAGKSGLNLAYFPRISFTKSYEEWWQGISGNSGWWQSWFDRYRTYLLNYSELAVQAESSGIIIGDPGIMWPQPGVSYSNNLDFPGPQYPPHQWLSLINNVHSIYPSLNIYWAMEFPFFTNIPSEYLDLIDGFYLIWNKPLSSSPNPDRNELTNNILTDLDEYIFPLKEQTGKKIILSIKYPSIDGAVFGCIIQESSCQSFGLLDQPNMISNIQFDFNEHSDIYQSFLDAINQRSWIDGVGIWGYYPPLKLMDNSSSIRGKAAEKIVDYWLHNFSVELD